MHHSIIFISLVNSCRSIEVKKYKNIKLFSLSMEESDIDQQNIE